MKFMKKRTQSILIAICLLTIISIPTIALASNIGSMLNDAGTNAGYDTKGGDTALAEIVGTIIRAFLSLLGVVFISLIIYAGILWMIAAGNDEQIGKAKKIMTGAFIGLVITLSAFSIYFFISEYLLNGKGSEGGVPNGGTGSPYDYTDD